MATWLTADWHLGETRLELLGRPFETPRQMLNHLVKEHNKVIRPDDDVIVVGDAVVTAKSLKDIAKFNGRKTLIRGNHDRGYSDEILLQYFERIIPEGEGIEITYDCIPLYITHYPTRGRKEKFNIVGHTHSAWKVQKNMLNVGIDVHHNRPVPLSKIPFFYKAICGFYDLDVWVGDNEINAFPNRGKQSVYFEQQSNLPLAPWE